MKKIVRPALIIAAAATLAFTGNAVRTQAGWLTDHLSLVRTRAAQDDVKVNFDMRWANAVSSDVRDYSYDTADTEHKNLIFHTLKNTSSGARLAGTLKITLQNGVVLPKGSVKITVPKSIFESWDGSGEVGIDNYYTALPTFSWQIPEAPAEATTSDFNYVDNQDGTLTITNFKSISGGTILDFEEKFAFRPSLVKVDAQGEYTHTFPVTFRIDAPGIPKIETGKDLTVTVKNHHKDAVSTIKPDDLSPEGGVYFDWMDSWGPRPADADQYFYVPWFVDMTGDYDNTIPYHLAVEQKDLANSASAGGDTDGELIGANRNGNNSYVGTTHISYLPSGTNTSYPNIAREDYAQVLSQPALLDYISGKNFSYMTNIQGIGSSLYSSVRYIMLKRYPVSLLEEARRRGVDLAETGIEVTNTVTVKDVLSNGVVKAKDITGTKQIFVHEYKGRYGIEKYNNETKSYNTIGGAATFLLAGEDVEVKPRAGYSSSYVTSASAAPSAEPAWDEAAKTYRVNQPYKMVITEDPIAKTKGISGGNRGAIAKTQHRSENKITAFTPDDYVYQSVWFSLAEMDAKRLSQNNWQISGNPSKDYARIKPIYLYTQTRGNSEYALYGTVTVDDQGHYNFEGADGRELANVGSANRIMLPDNVTGLRYEHESDFYESRLSAYPQVKLLPTDNVKSWLNEALEEKKARREDSPLVVNGAHLTVQENGRDKWTANTDYQPAWAAGNYLPELSINRYVDKNVERVTDDPLSGVQTADIHIHVGLYTGLWDSGKPVTKYLENYIVPSGTFWDLLPAGTVVDESSVRLTSGQWNTSNPLESNQYTVEFIDNWKNSGQTMMKVDFRNPERVLDYRNYTNHGWSIHMRYKLKNTYNNISDRGTQVINTVLFENTSDKPSAFGPNMNVIERAGKRQYYEDLVNGIQKDWRAATSPVNYLPVTVRQSGVDKDAANDHDKVYGDEAYAYIGNKYSYQLSYAMGSDTRADGIVFYDVLDNGSDIHHSEWKGTLGWIDTTSVEQKTAYGLPGETCKPVVYYATKIPTPAEQDIRRTDIWSTAKPADNRVIKAIAIDCTTTDKGNPFILDIGKGLNIHVHMVAPMDEQLHEKFTDNQVRVKARTFNGTSAPAGTPVRDLDAEAKVFLEKVDLELHKKSMPESGTRENPAEVRNLKDEPVLYTLTVKNKDNRLNLRNIKLEDAIPSLLEPDLANVKITEIDKAGQAKRQDELISRVDFVSVRADHADANKLTFTINSLPAAEELQITIPTKLKEAVKKTTVFDNTAYITEVEGIGQADFGPELKKAAVSETTWHKLVQQYKVDYTVKPDPVYGVPQGSEAPAAAENLDYDTTLNLAAGLTTSQKKTEQGVSGEWHFDGWSEDETAIREHVVTSVRMDKDRHLFGQWRFKPAVTVPVEKIWLDHQGEPMNEAPVKEVKVSLLRDGHDTGKTLTLREENQWTDEFANLPSYNWQEEKDFEYTVREKGDAAGFVFLDDVRYDVTYDEDNHGLTVTNRLTYAPPVPKPEPKTRTITVIKHWNGVEKDEAYFLLEKKTDKGWEPVNPGVDDPAATSSDAPKNYVPYVIRKVKNPNTATPSNATTPSNVTASSGAAVPAPAVGATPANQSRAAADEIPLLDDLHGLLSPLENLVRAAIPSAGRRLLRAAKATPATVSQATGSILPPASAVPYVWMTTRTVEDDGAEYRVVETDRYGVRTEQEEIDGEDTDVLTLGSNRYAVTYGQNGENVFEIFNRELYQEPSPEKPETGTITVTKSWKGTPRDSAWFLLEKRLPGEEEWKPINVHVFGNLYVPYRVKTGAVKTIDILADDEAEYRIVETGRFGEREKDGRIRLGGTEYTVAYEGSREDGFLMVNSEVVPDPVPEPTPDPEPKPAPEPGTPSEPQTHGGSGGHGGGGNGGTKVTPVSPAPTAQAPEAVPAKPGQTPTTQKPSTDDKAQTLLWLAMLAAGMDGFLWVLHGKKPRGGKKS